MYAVKNEFECNMHYIRRRLLHRFRASSLFLCSILVIAITIYYYFFVREFKFNNTSYGNDVISRFHSNSKMFTARTFEVSTVTGKSFAMQLEKQKFYHCVAVIMQSLFQMRWNNFYFQNELRGGLFLYSAFYDKRSIASQDRSYSFVRILGMHDGSNLHKHYYCQISFRHFSRMPIVTTAEFVEIWFPDWDSDTRHESYKPCIFSCIMPNKYAITLQKQISSLKVSVVDRPCKIAHTYLAVKHVNLLNEKKKMFIICVKPLDFSRDLSVKLIEWIEANIILGIDTIHIYKFKVHPNVDKVLKYYERLGIVIITESTVPGNQPNFPIERSAFHKRNLWQKRRNELLPYNDCFYQHIYSHEYVIPMDIDELIVPKIHRTLPELFEHIYNNVTYSHLKLYASFSVRNVYFFESFTDSFDSKSYDKGSYFTRHIYRSANFSNASKSVKSFLRTDVTFTVFNHYALETLWPGIGRNTELPVELVQMNHYRSSCPSSMSSECKNNFLKYVQKDTILLKFKHDLLRRVQYTVKSLKLNA